MDNISPKFMSGVFSQKQSRLYNKARYAKNE